MKQKECRYSKKDIIDKKKEEMKKSSKPISTGKYLVKTNKNTHINCCVPLTPLSTLSRQSF